jgi:hypothetical protein
MHLTREDIEHVANMRFNNSHMKYYFLVLFGGLAALAAFTLGLGHAFPGNIWPGIAADIPVGALIILGMLRYDKAQRRAAEEFIKQCELDPYLIYIGDTKTEVLCSKEKTVLP